MVRVVWVILVEVVAMVVMKLPGLSHIAAVSIIAVAVATIAALVVRVVLQVDIPAGSLPPGDTILHDPPVPRNLGAHPAPGRASAITKLVPSLIDPAEEGEVRWGRTTWNRIVTNWMVSFG